MDIKKLFEDDLNELISAASELERALELGTTKKWIVEAEDYLDEKKKEFIEKWAPILED